MNWDFSLSASKLNKFNECPRCFWDMANRKLEYRGIFPSLPGGLDRVLKGYTDGCRMTGAMPLEMVGTVPADAKLYGTVEEMKKMRHWKSNPLKPLVSTQSGVVSLILAFDDLLIDARGISPFDWKSKGDKPKDNGAQYYQTQLDIYTLAGQVHGWTMSGFGYLGYLWPDGYDATGRMRMGSEVYELACDADRAKELIARAAACLAGSRPEQSVTCELCKFMQMRAA